MLRGRGWCRHGCDSAGFPDAPPVRCCSDCPEVTRPQGQQPLVRHAHHLGYFPTTGTWVSKSVSSPRAPDCSQGSAVAPHSPSPACVCERPSAHTQTLAAGTSSLHPLQQTLHDGSIFTPNARRGGCLRASQHTGRRPCHRGLGRPPAPTAAVRPRLRPGPEAVWSGGAGAHETGCRGGRSPVSWPGSRRAALLWGLWQDSRVCYIPILAFLLWFPYQDPHSL